MIKVLFLLLISNIIISAQSFEYLESIGKFNNASSFYITANGLIYISDFGKDEIVMIDTLGNNLKSFGGYGWDENSFDDPSDVFADPLTIYISDKNNHSIKRFDKSLNYLSALYKRESDNSEEQFGYPVSCATSNQGDLYFIDSENKRIMKFDIFGNFISSFGGFDAGKYQLSDPIQLAVNSFNNIFVIDETDIKVFDHYGNGISILSTESSLKSIRILFDQLTTCTNKDIYYANLKVPDPKLTKISLGGFDYIEIVSTIMFNNKLYVLTNNTILIFNKI
jgi:DNA-binding beta-propeller fold protein YncE